MAANIDLTGARFGHLTVLKKLPEVEDRYTLWRCRCDCGNEIRVNTKRLRRGTVQGCPDCWTPRGRIEPLDLSGQRFGRLTVRSLSPERLHGRRTWACVCDCGKEVLATTHDLQCGHVQSCGCLVTMSNRLRSRDLTGEVFGWLTALEATDRRDRKGSVIWRCRCQCGKACEVSEDCLVNGRTVSCGCYRETMIQARLNERLHRIDGTCVEHLKRKLRSDNRSGHPGVYELPNGRWLAHITFKGRRYHLGVYDRKQDALRARLRGEELHDDFLRWYYETYLPEEKTKKREAEHGKTARPGQTTDLKTKEAAQKGTERQPERGAAVAVPV